MSYGLQTFNPTGNVQIDSRFEGIVELTRGEFEPSSTLHGDRWGFLYYFSSYLPIQYTTNPKWLLLIRPTGKFTVYDMGFFHRGSSPYNSRNVDVAAYGKTLKWVIGVPESENGRGDDDDYGLLIWNAEGKRVFNSAHYTIIPERVVIFTPNTTFPFTMPSIDVILPPLPENWEYYVNYNSTGEVLYSSDSWEYEVRTHMEFVSDNHLRIYQDVWRNQWPEDDVPGWAIRGPRTLVVYKVRTLN